MEHTFKHGKALRETIDLDDSFKVLIEMNKGLSAFLNSIEDEWNESLQDYVNDKLQWFYNERRS